MEREKPRKPLPNEEVLKKIKKIHAKKLPNGEVNYEALFGFVDSEIRSRELNTRILGAEAIKDVEDTNREDNE